MMETIAKRGGAFITILSESPDLLRGVDSKKSPHSKSRWIALHTYRQYVQSDKSGLDGRRRRIKRLGEKIFPDKTDEEAVALLWDQILKSLALIKQTLWRLGKSTMSRQMKRLKSK
ncbi:aminopeptidase [Bacillus sp. SL00103]